MGTGQMLVTIGAIVLLGSIILTTNRGISNSSQVLLQTSFGIDEVSLATSVIEKAQDLAFDDHTKDSTWINALSGLTPPTSLGQENGDATDLDDFDDFNGLPNQKFRIEFDTLSTGIYEVKTHVSYVTRNATTGSLDTTSTGATWSKQLTVWVWNTVDTAHVVKMSSVFSYWY